MRGISAKNLPIWPDCKAKCYKPLQSDHRANLRMILNFESLECIKSAYKPHNYSIPNYTELHYIPWNRWKPLFIRLWSLFSWLKYIRHNINYTELAEANRGMMPNMRMVLNLTPSGKTNVRGRGRGGSLTTFNLKRRIHIL